MTLIQDSIKKVQVSLLNVCYKFKLLGPCLLKVSNRNTRTLCEICSMLTTNTPELRHWRHSGVLLLTLSRIQTLLWYFRCWIWTSRCRLGSVWITNIWSTKIPFSSIMYPKLFVKNVLWSLWFFPTTYHSISKESLEKGEDFLHEFFPKFLVREPLSKIIATACFWKTYCVSSLLALTQVMEIKGFWWF